MNKRCKRLVCIFSVRCFDLCGGVRMRRNYVKPSEANFCYLRRDVAVRYIRRFGGKLVNWSSWSGLYDADGKLIAYVPLT